MSKQLAPTYFVEQCGGLAVPRRLAEGYLSENAQQLPQVIYTEIRALTADVRTHNNTFYPEASLRGTEADGTGLISFTRPYPIPLIKDHNTTAGPFGGGASEVYGRVFHPAQFIRQERDGYARVMATISHPEAVEGVMSGRWLTTSLGSRTESVACSICLTELTRGMCDHERGEDYDVEGAPIRAMWMIGPIKAKELSFVVAPSDDRSGVITPHNTQFPTESYRARILVGDARGVFDLTSGAKIDESAFFVPRAPRKSVYAVSMPAKPAASVGRAAENQVTPAGFHGAGEYLLGGHEHEHLVVLDDRGYGNSGPAYKPSVDYSRSEPTGTEPRPAPAPGTSATEGRSRAEGLARARPGIPVGATEVDSHSHYVSAGAPSPGEDNHVHQLIPTDVPDRRDPHEQVRESEDAPLTFAVLFLLPDSDPDAGRTEVETTEAVLTAKTRRALPTSAFCGPNRSFPAQDKAHVRAGLAYLDRSHLTPDQKSRTQACLIRRGKSMSMDMSGAQKGESQAETPAAAEQPTAEHFAARLVDAEHRVEVDLYPLPTTVEQLDAVLGQVRAMPHTEEERGAILGRLAAHSRPMVGAAEWQTRFGSLTVCETGPAVPVPITTANYALVYAALANCPALAARATETPCESCGDPPVAESAPAPEAAPSVPVAETVEAPAAPAAPDPLALLERELAAARAHAVVLHQFALRKSAARGQSFEALLAKYQERSAVSLQDTLADLAEEWAAHDGSLPVALPRIADPTTSKEAATETVIDNSVPAVPAEPPPAAPVPTFSTAGSLAALQEAHAGEIALEADDPEANLIYRLYPELAEADA